MKVIEICENGLHILFRVRENGVTELADFSAAEIGKQIPEPSEDYFHPLFEICLTGTGTDGIHGYKNNLYTTSREFAYENHELKNTEAGKELCILLKGPGKLEARYHLRLFDGIPMAQVYTEIKNCGEEEQGLNYVSSFIYQGLFSGGKVLYPEKTDIYVPYNSWYTEAQWRKYDIRTLNLNEMLLEGFRQCGFGVNRYTYSGKSSWTSCEYLPMGLAEDRETGETYIFQIEASGQWLVEYGSGQGRVLYLSLSGATEQEHGWWKKLKPGETFTTVPAAVGVVKGGLNPAMAAMTRYRRKIRRPNADDEKLNVVFNDYMNCLEGDPTTEKELPMIDRAAELGCEYYCMDCGWYDDGFWWDRVGEWKESKARFPEGGMKKVCDYAHSKGMKMGLWLEIEAMGTKCELAERLPEWETPCGQWQISSGFP